MCKYIKLILFTTQRPTYQGKSTKSH